MYVNQIDREIKKEGLTYPQLLTLVHAWCLDNPGKFGYVRVSDARTGQAVYHTGVGAHTDGSLARFGRDQLDRAVEIVRRKARMRAQDRFDLSIKLNWSQSHGIMEQREAFGGSLTELFDTPTFVTNTVADADLAFELYEGGSIDALASKFAEVKAHRGAR